MCRQTDAMRQWSSAGEGQGGRQWVHHTGSLHQRTALRHHLAPGQVTSRAYLSLLFSSLPTRQKIIIGWHTLPFTYRSMKLLSPTAANPRGDGRNRPTPAGSDARCNESHSFPLIFFVFFLLFIPLSSPHHSFFLPSFLPSPLLLLPHNKQIPVWQTPKSPLWHRPKSPRPPPSRARPPAL